MIKVSASGLTLTESDTGYDTLTFLISLDAAPTETVYVPWRLALGSAVFGSDTNYYSEGYITGIATFSAGETVEEVRVYPNGDFEVEADESFVLELLPPTNARLEGNGLTYQAVGWVLDDDGGGKSLSMHISDPIVLEGDKGWKRVDFTLTLSEPAEKTYKIPYQLDGATKGVDYQGGSGNVTIHSGQSEATVSIKVRGDKALEGLEYVNLKLDLPKDIAEATGGQLTIIDDDARGPGPLVTISDARVSEADSGYNHLVFSVTLSEASSETLTVPWRLVPGTATFGSDTNYYTGGYVGGTLYFSAGETQETITVYPTGDLVSELDETFIMEIFQPQNARLAGEATVQQAIGWVLDDDGTGNPRTLQVVDTVIQEGDKGSTTASVRLELSRPAEQDLKISYQTINGSAKAGKDFAFESGSLRIMEGQTSATIDLRIIGDVVKEGNEEFGLKFFLPNAIRKAAGGTITILNEDKINKVHNWTGDGSRDEKVGTGNPDHYFGRGGNDVLTGKGNHDRLSGGNGHDRLLGDSGNDWLSGDAGSDRLSGGDGSDKLFGGDGVDVLLGASGRDRLDGGAGIDRLEGGAGNDWMRGGAGNDQLLGGQGSDMFVFGKNDGSDRILDWNDRQDQITIQGIRSIRALDIDQSGKNAVVEFGDTRIVLLNTDADALGREDFLF